MNFQRILTHKGGSLPVILDELASQSWFHAALSLR